MIGTFLGWGNAPDASQDRFSGRFREKSMNRVVTSAYGVVGMPWKGEPARSLDSYLRVSGWPGCYSTAQLCAKHAHPLACGHRDEMTQCHFFRFAAVGLVPRGCPTAHAQDAGRRHTQASFRWLVTHRSFYLD